MSEFFNQQSSQEYKDAVLFNKLQSKICYAEQSTQDSINSLINKYVLNNEEDPFLNKEWLFKEVKALLNISDEAELSYINKKEIYRRIEDEKKLLADKKETNARNSEYKLAIKKRSLELLNSTNKSLSKTVLALGTATVASTAVVVINVPGASEQIKKDIGNDIKKVGSTAREIVDFTVGNFIEGYNSKDIKTGKNTTIEDIDNSNNPKTKNIEKLVDTDKDGVPDVVEKTAGEVDLIKTK